MAEEVVAKTRRSGDARKERKSKAGWLGIWIVALVLVLGVAGLVGYAACYEGIFPNTYIGDCNVSGLAREDALVLVNETYRSEGLRGKELSISCKKNRAKLSLDEMNVLFDNPASVELAVKESSYSNIFAKTWGMAKHLLGDTRISPVFTYDKEKLEDVVVSVVGEYEIQPENYTFEIQEDQVVLYGKVDGVKVDRAILRSNLEERFWKGDFTEMKLTLTPINPEPLDFDQFYKWLTSKPENAVYEKGEDGVITVRPGKLQCQVDKETVKTALESVDSSAENKITFPVTTKAPEYTEEGLTKQLYQDVLGSYTTYYSGTAARNNNVQLATSRINGVEMMPGDEFSYDKTILPRTYDNGYQAAPVYVGNKVESGMGGGICQPSSTLYGAVLYANLEILERHNHSMLVGYMPAGLDATIAQGYLDLRFKNNTGYPIKIEATASGGTLTISILGYNPENLSVEIIRSGGGYSYSATRVVKKGGEEISREKLPSSKYSPKAPEEPEETEDPEATDPNAPEDPNAAGETEPGTAPDTTDVPGTPAVPEATPVVPPPVTSAPTVIEE